MALSRRSTVESGEIEEIALCLLDTAYNLLGQGGVVCFDDPYLMINVQFNDPRPSVQWRLTRQRRFSYTALLYTRSNVPNSQHISRE